jgi:hypothetical protein
MGCAYKKVIAAYEKPISGNNFLEKRVIAAYNSAYHYEMTSVSMHQIIGREDEIATLTRRLNSPQAEFIVVYGRRRIGKTYLISKFFSDKGVYFECTGIKDGDLRDQLDNFITAFQGVFFPKLQLLTPTSWKAAFQLLTEQLQLIASKQKIILFFDELPWLATVKSNFMQALDYVWNTQWSRMPNVKLVVCGSAASWMLDRLINAKGGLHNRITEHIRLKPFNLRETKTYLTEYLKIKLSLSQIVTITMVMGGVPFYLNQLDRNLSLDENISRLCFSEEGLLATEFPRLFRALFDAYDINLKIVKALADFRYGLTLAELLKKTKRKAGGRFTKRLEELEAAGFIEKLLPFDRTQRDHYYRLSDEYSLFYLKWILPAAGKLPSNTHYWLQLANSSSWHAWAGYSFEMICYKHKYEIARALHIDHLGYLATGWSERGSKHKQGAQIDLMFDRSDNAISVCEIKHSNHPITLDRLSANNFKNKLDAFECATKTTKQLFLVLIAMHGLKENAWSKDLVNHVVTLADLFV